GARIRLVLHNTYWQLRAPTDPAVLRERTPPTVAPAKPGRCVPGAGCGTISAAFVAARPGRAQLRASRTTCGEVLRCTGGHGRFRVEVRVTA
ncbi:MAG TPA: hypothetical protein VE261_00025, partial [Gaiellaceae bacterium]|nr:hypothetical protein [Gaiellaceae bacterium]